MTRAEFGHIARLALAVVAQVGVNSALAWTDWPVWSPGVVTLWVSAVLAGAFGGYAVANAHWFVVMQHRAAHLEALRVIDALARDYARRPSHP